MFNVNLSATHPMWILLMLAGFIFWWPLGLLVLALILWSGNMGRINGQWWERAKSIFGGFRFGSGNSMFDKHREEVMRKLDEEEKQFREFVDKMRFTKDADEFDKFMNERKGKKS